MISRHLLLVVAVLTAHTAFAQTDPPYVPQPCPFDCFECNPVNQTCTSCADGYRLDRGRCYLEACDTAMAHKARMASDGSRDDRMATWAVSSVDGSTHTVEISVYVPPRFHCELTGHALTDALHWEEWLDNATTTPCPHYDIGDGATPPYCGPTTKRWTPVLMLGREADDAEGFIKLPIGAANAQTSCLTAYRHIDNYTIVDQTETTDNLVTNYDPVDGAATMRLPLMELTDPSDPLHCDDIRPEDLYSGVEQYGADGARFRYWQKEVVGAVTNWRFDATLCYVDETGEQSVCPFSSPVWQMSINGITDGVSVTPAGTAELIYVPRCQLFIRSAQIRYDGEIESRNATGEFEIAVTCEGTDYVPDITNITHCECEEDDYGHCKIYEEESSCDNVTDTCTVTARFNSWTFNASLSDFLQLECPDDPTLEDGRFVVTIAHDDEDCVATDSCVPLSPTKLFGAAPLQATDELRDLAGFNDTNTHSIYAGLMKSNDLRLQAGEDAYFHQFNRTYLEFTTIRRVVGPDQKNSFVMCAMMQPDGYGISDSIDPDDIEYKFRVSILEVTFDVEWEDGRAFAPITLTDLLAGNERWPSQWVWEHQEELALRRQVIGRRTGRASAPCGPTVCEVTPMQDHVHSYAGWDHIEENVDCVGISPFYFYSLLTLDDPEAIVLSTNVTLTVQHEYLGRYEGAGARRRLLQVGADDPVFAREQIRTGGGAFQWIQKSDAQQQQNMVTQSTEASATESTIPIMPIVIGVMAASMTCMFFAAFAFWRRRKKPEDKLGPEAQFHQPNAQPSKPQVVVKLDDIQLSTAGQV